MVSDNEDRSNGNKNVKNNDLGDDMYPFILLHLFINAFLSFLYREM